MVSLSCFVIVVNSRNMLTTYLKSLKETLLDQDIFFNIMLHSVGSFFKIFTFVFIIEIDL